MLTLHSKLITAMLKLAHKEHPIETCGIIAGKEGSNLPTRLIPMRNMANSAEFFQFDSQQQLQVWRELEDRGEEVIVIFHSHTHSHAYPSRDDVLHAS